MQGREDVSYLRVSTQLQGLDGFGIAAQRDAVDRFSRAFACSIVSEYAEVETGRKDHLRNRPQLVLAVAHARRSKALLVIGRFDRLARSVLVTSQLLKSGVEFVACDNPHANRLTIHILAAMAEHEGRLIFERTKAGLAAAKAPAVKFGNGGHFLTPEARAKGQQAAKVAHIRARTRLTPTSCASMRPPGSWWINAHHRLTPYRPRAPKSTSESLVGCERSGNLYSGRAWPSHEHLRA